MGWKAQTKALLLAAAVPAVSCFASGPCLPSGSSSSLRSSASSAMRMGGEDGMSRRGLLAGIVALPLAGVLAPSEANAQFEFLTDTKGARPAGLGPRGDRFLNLCDSENCVSTSEDVYSKRFLPPWTYNPEEKKKSTAEAKAELVAVIKEQKGATIITEKDNVALPLCPSHTALPVDHVFPPILAVYLYPWNVDTP
jgi:hypothetical protein